MAREDSSGKARVESQQETDRVLAPCIAGIFDKAILMRVVDFKFFGSDGEPGAYQQHHRATGVKAKSVTAAAQSFAGDRRWAKQLLLSEMPGGATWACIFLLTVKKISSQIIDRQEKEQN